MREERDLRSIVGDGVAFSAMVGLGETYVPAFALAIGHGEVVAGLIASLPMLAGAFFQLLTPWAVRHLQSYRRWVVLCACLQGLSFLPLVAGAVKGQLALHWLAAAVVGYWAFGMATSPAWNAWVTSLVPEGTRHRFFAHRTRLAQASLFISVMLGGLSLEWGRGAGIELEWFAVLFGSALFARMVSAAFLARQSETPGLASHHHALGPGAVLAAIRAAGSTRILLYLVCMHVAVHLAAPYFTPYMLGSLGLSYAEFTTLTAVAFLARIMVLPGLGRLAERHGTRAILWWGAVGIVVLPSLWLVSSSFAYLLCVQTMAGVAWAALEYATLMSFFEGIEDRVRASVLSAYNLLTALALCTGAYLGSLIFDLVENADRYVWLFVLSSLGRLLILPILGNTATGRARGILLRTLAVRPNAGSIDRPILATVEPRSDGEDPS